MREQRKRRNDGGITLIALVVTIIILLILAGVTLATVLSDGGLIDKTKDAIAEHENAQEKEQEELGEAAGMMKNLIDGLGSTGGTTPTTPEGQKTVVTTVTEITNETIYGEDSLGNPVVIPGGFKFAGEEGDTVEEGIIIEDDEGNQFVWIPVSNIDGSKTGLIKTTNKGDVEITLGRYKFKNQKNQIKTANSPDGTPEIVQKGSESISDDDRYKFSWTFLNSAGTITRGDYKENTSLTRTNGGEGAKNLAEFITSVEENHGYYLARYEASYKSGNSANDYKPYSKPSTNKSESSMSYTVGTLWNYITQGDASKVSQNMYSEGDSEEEYVESDLVNSYAWDTAIVYIQAMGNANYANANRGTNTSLLNTGDTNDVKCNIYDMAGNVSEWTTEYTTQTYNSGKFPCVVRGGYCYNSNDYTAVRHDNGTTYSTGYIGFRPLLYLK